MRIFVFVVAMLGGPALADPLCDDLWFTRNLVFDRAGYCFDSALGQAVFSNEGCRTSNPNLSRAERSLVNLVRDTELDWGCRVNPSHPRALELDVKARFALRDLPVRTGYESGCIGWRTTPMVLRTGRSDGAARAGSVSRGDDVGFSFVSVDGWEYVNVFRDGEMIGEGWGYFGEHDPSRCTGWAG